MPSYAELHPSKFTEIKKKIIREKVGLRRYFKSPAQIAFDLHTEKCQ